MADVKKIQCSTNCAQPVVFDLAGNSGQTEETFHIPTIEDIQALGRLISGGVGNIADDTGGVVLGGFGAFLLAPLRLLAERMDRINYEQNVFSVLLPKDTSPSEYNPLVITPEGGLRVFGNMRALERVLNRFTAYLRGNVPSNLTEAELEVFTHTPGPNFESREVGLMNGRTVHEYIISGSRSTDEALRREATALTRSGEETGVSVAPRASGRQLQVVYLYDGESEEEIVRQVREIGKSEPLMTQIGLSGIGLAEGPEYFFEQVRRADAYSDNLDIERLGEYIDAHYSYNLPDQAARELARRAMVEWRELSDVGKTGYLKGVPTAEFMNDFLLRTEVTAFVGTVEAMVKEREAKEKEFADKIAREARRMFRAAGR